MSQNPIPTPFPLTPYLYCYVRLRTGIMRATTLKVFYHENITIDDFNKQVSQLGHIKSIDFPEKLEPYTTCEILAARREHRIIRPTTR